VALWQSFQGQYLVPAPVPYFDKKRQFSLSSAQQNSAETVLQNDLSHSEEQKAEQGRSSFWLFLLMLAQFLTLALM